MSSTHIHPRWFALTVRPNHECTSELGLLAQGIEAYVPRYRSRRKWSDRTKEVNAVLFPGYVFCKFAHAESGRVLRSPGVRSVVGAPREPFPIDDSEVDSIRKLISSGCPVSPWPYIRNGEQVVIHSGPLASLRGVVLRTKDAWRVVVSVEALGCSASIEVDRDMIAPEKTICPA
jgi:transcription antitermination factor NusG